jgi:hypothetical protein
VKKESKVNVTVTNNYANFKCRLPLEWLNVIGINQENKEINICYKDNKLYIRKTKIKKFRELSSMEKKLQIKKFEILYSHLYEHKKDLIDKMEEYFNISYRTAYRHLQEKVSTEELKEVKLIDKQEENTRNINIMFVKINQTITPTITVPTNLAILLLEGKSYEELGIKSAYEIYKKNFSCPIIMQLDENNKYISMERK